MSDREHENAPGTPSPLVSRRQFIRLGLTLVGAAWGGTLVQSRLFPDQSAGTEAKPVEFPLSELPVGGSKQVTYGGVSVMVLRTPESVKAFSMVCTHLGCLINWEAGKQEFYCPCHDGRFDQFGEVISGPPVVPLEQFSVKIDGERVIVGEA